MTLLEVYNVLKSTGFAQPNVHTVVDEFTDLNREDTEYSAVVYQQREHSRDDQFVTYNWYIGYVDRLAADKSNEIEVQSTAINVIQNIVNTINHTFYPDIQINAGQIIVFTQRFEAECAGAYADVSILIPVSDCADVNINGSLFESLNETLTENGEYHFVPKGVAFDNVTITVDVQEGSIQEDKEVYVDYNGEIDINPDEGYDALRHVSLVVAVPEVGIQPIKYESITSNGEFDITADSGYDVIDTVHVEVDVHPSQTLIDAIVENGNYDYDEEYNGVSINVDVHPSQTLIDTVDENGEYYYDDEYNGVSITVDVHPSRSFTSTYLSNGTYPITGEFKNGQITISTPVKKSEVALSSTILSNGTISFIPSAGYVYSQATITTDIHPSQMFRDSYTENGEYSYDGEWAGAFINVDVHPEYSFNSTYTSNGVFIDEGEYSGVSINVDVHPSQSFTSTYLSNGTYPIAGEFKNGQITISTPVPAGTITISENGTYNVASFASAIVNVQTAKPEMTFSVIPSNLDQDVIPDEGYAFSRGTVVGYDVDPIKYKIDDINAGSVHAPGTPLKEILEGPINLIDDTASFVRSSCFDGCGTLKSIRLSVNSIYYRAFDRCAGLSTIILPNIEYIGQDAFTSAYSPSIYLGDPSINKTIVIDSYAFQCPFPTFYISSPNVAFLYGHGITGASKIYVPTSLYDAYRSNALWSVFKSIIYSSTFA